MPTLLLGSLRELHVGLAWVVVVGNGVAGAWALGAHSVGRLRTTALWWFTGAVQAAVFVEVALGTAMVGAQGVAAPEFHMFYGFIALVAIGILYSYRQPLRHRLYLLYGFGGLFVMGLGIRASLVGR